MRSTLRLLACGVLAVALVAGPGIAQAGAGGQAAAAKRQAKATRAAKRVKLNRFILRQAAAALGITVRQLGTELQGRSLAQVAEAHGMSAAELQAAIVAAFKARLDRRVAEQKITQERANRALARFEQRVARLMNRVFAGTPGPLRKRAVRIPFRAVALKASAAFLGLTRQQLRQQLPGTSLAQLAEAQGKSSADLQAAIVNAFDARLDRAVERGLDQQRADRILERVRNRVDDFVAKVWPARQ